MSDTDHAQDNDSNNTIGQRKLDKINAAAKSRELREAEAIVDEADISISAAEQREIDAMAESESERAELREEMVAEKRQREVIRVAREGVNDAVPSRHIVQRPSYGPVSGTAQYHMRNSYAFLLGRNRSGDSITSQDSSKQLLILASLYKAISLSVLMRRGISCRLRI